MKTLKVSDLIGQVKSLLESQFRSIVVEGEISNFSHSSSGHYYFTLSDSQSSISCALFRGDALRNPEVKRLKDGDKILLSGSIGVYAKRGTFQVIAKSLKKIGKGDLKEQFEKLKLRLKSEGLFDSTHKKEIPKFPKKVAVITALNAAALSDFLNVFNRRSLDMDIMVSPALVQGDQAPFSIREALTKVIKYHLEVSPIDVVVLTRGGGSLEDLWAFNDEGLAWDIYNCPIPTISAVGHQVDFSISDFVSDLRMETPTAAAEYLTQHQTTLKLKLNRYDSFFKSYSQMILNQYQSRLQRVHPNHLLQGVRENLFIKKSRLSDLKLIGRSNELIGLKDYFYRMDELQNRLVPPVRESFSSSSMKAQRLSQLLESLNPNNVLKRGYTYITNSKGKVVPSKGDFDNSPKDEILSVRFHDGVTKITKD